MAVDRASSAKPMTASRLAPTASKMRPVTGDMSPMRAAPGSRARPDSTAVKSLMFCMNIGMP